MNDVIRCAWGSNERLARYHDAEWGVPVNDDRLLFEHLVLDGAQAGLSWDTVLRKRDRYREVYDGFDVETVSRYGDAKIAELLEDPGIIRNRLKVVSSIENAKRFLDVQAEFGRFSLYVWSFVGGKPIQNAWTDMSQLPATSKESDALSKDLKRRGFKFVGSTIVYAAMQASGLVNDHVVTCFRYEPVRAMAETFEP